MLKKRFFTISRLCLILALSLMVSCVGTVQDSKVDINSLSEEDKELISFPGLEKAVGISHDKVELEFTPLGTTDPNVKYFLYINGGQSPIEVNPASLDDALAGRKRYLVSGLNINNLYKFKLKIKNALTNAESKSEKELVAQTFDNKTSDFKGITSVSKVTGLSATSVFLEWVPAHMDGVIIAQGFDPIYYEVTVIGAGGAQNLNNPNYTGLDRRVIKVPDPTTTQISPSNHSQYTSILVDSLTPATTHFFQVRAVNKLWYNFSIDPLVSTIPVSREVNTKFLKLKTDPATGLFDFNVDSLRVANAPGADAFTKINTFWSPGIGTFTGYRIFLRKYANATASLATVLGDDRLPIDQMQKVINGELPATDANGFFVNANTTKTSLQITGLDTYEWYQVKIIQCKNADCPVSPLTEPNIGIVSELRAIRVQPSLAPFDGISRIDNPKDATGLDEITASFDPPTLSIGYADKLEVYCLESGAANAAYDPVPLSTVARAGSSVSKCNGLYLTDPPLVSDNKLIIKGVKSIPSSAAADATYCFATFPAIRDQAEQIPLAGTFPTSDWVVRCITPEVKTPTVVQFEGLKGTCNPVQNTIATNWVAPTGGLYANYRLYYRTISGSETFKFSDAIAGDIAYQSISIPKGTISRTLTGLRPGTRYRVGVLTEIVSGTKTLYSEFNTNIQDCVTPMPVATFDQWSRVFAIGPKVDGRFPHGKTLGNRVVPEAAKILEALNVDGIPYEVPTDSSGNIIPAGYLRPPGHYHASYMPSTFNDYFDGAFGKYQAVDVAGSKNGIVSLGWKDMSLDFLGLEFQECQRHPTDAAVTTNSNCTTVPALRSGRKYGYKVFRSVDNRLSWQDVTGANGPSGISLVYARDYKFYKRANMPATTERMAFFTDYSVQAIYTDPEGKERGRILWYKVVPYFEKKPLSISGGGLTTPNIIKVVLPPPNMALVKREIANRNACMEIGRDDSMDKSNTGYYSCAWNGIGGRPKGNPWKVAESIIDLGGDLLVDRFELGCQYTRGDYSSVPENGLSFFMKPTPYSGSQTNLAKFKGYRTDSQGNDTTENLQGCTNAHDWKVNLDSNFVSQNSSVTPNYKKTLYGDCHGTGSITMASSVCANPDKTDQRGYKYPGAQEPASDYVCSNIVNDDPENFADRLNVEFRRYLLIQSEFAAVFYHRDQTKYDMVYPTGPGHVNAVSNTNWYGKQKQCFINLAAIGSDGKVRARWFPAEDLNQIKSGAGIQSYTNKGISQTYTDTNLYDTGEYKLPAEGLRVNTRFDNTTTLGKIISANTAKLPPLTGISQELAQEYCSAYNIEVGISTDGTNFLATTLPTTKRLMRKVELLAASHWPIASLNDVTQSFNYNESRITSLEGTNLPGNCISSIRKVSNGGMGRNSDINPGFATLDPLGTGLLAGKSITGSSFQDGSTPEHSEKCVSEYGVQDLVGNVAELSTERIFCDYSKDKLWYGVYDGDPFTQSGVGDESRSVQIPDNQSNERLFWSELTMFFEKADGTFKEVGTKANPAKPDSSIIPTIAWPQPDTNSGYCSIVDQTESYAQDMTRFRDTSDNFYLSTLSGGFLNTAMIPAINENKLDRESVNFLRNGDGAFLNFGTNNIAPQFKDGNSLAISDTGLSPVRGSMESMALGPFFNPWVGLPMACKGSSCNESDDNKRITTPYLALKVGADSPVITDFPVGNSQINNIGISDVVHSGNAAYEKRDLTLQPIDNGTIVIDSIQINLDGSVVYGNKTLSAFWDDHPETHGADQAFSGLRFALPRWTPLVFTNGGSFNQSTTGRYSSSMVMGSGENTKYTTGPGIRCGVMINSD